MEMVEIRERAKILGIKTFGLKKAVIIREIQKKEGNFPCFGTAEKDCDRKDCCWREDCLGRKFNA